MRPGLTAALWLLVLLGSTGLAAEPLRLLALQYPPYVYENQGHPDGLAVKVVQALFRNLDMEIEIQILPWGRSLKYMQVGQADGVFNLLKTEERQAYLVYLDEPLFEEQMALYSQRPLTFDGDFAPLNRYSVTIARAFSYGAQIDEALRKGSFSEVTTVNDYFATFRQLARGRADLLFSDERAAQYYKAQLPQGELIRKIGPTIERIHSYLAFSEKFKNSDLPARVNREISRLKASGEYGRLVGSTRWRLQP